MNTLLFDALEKPHPLEPLPPLSQFDRISLDTETTGLNIWAGDKPVGVALATPTFSRYFPFGHDAELGPQYDKWDVIEWLVTELRGKEIVFHHAMFDLMMLWALGVDLRHGDNTIHDTMFIGALLDEYGRFSLGSMAQRYLGKDKKDIGSKEGMQHRPPHVVAPYAAYDARLTYDLYERLIPEIHEQSLTRVYKLEQAVIPAVMEMEINGLPLDVIKLEQWRGRVTKEIAQYENTYKVNVNASSELKRFFDRHGWVHEWNYKCQACHVSFRSSFKNVTCTECLSPDTKRTTPHFGEQFLSTLDYPEIKDLLRLRKLHALQSKYLDPWYESTATRGGVLRFKLNQLRSDDYGTVSGRFSSSGVFSGAHPQQVWNREAQKQKMGNDYIVRDLFTSKQGLVAAIDASQIEFRLFSHYAKDDTMLRAYNEDPNCDFHSVVTKQVLSNRITRGQAKHINFGILYGMGTAKTAKQLGVSFDEAGEILMMYEQAFPAAKQLAVQASNIAKRQGYVRTWYHRRARFPEVKSGVLDTSGKHKSFHEKRKSTHSALNRVLQGSAADIMKDTLVAVYSERKKYEITLRITVHDEIVGDMPSKEHADRLAAMMAGVVNPPLRVPLIWNAKVGPTW